MVLDSFLIQTWALHCFSFSGDGSTFYEVYFKFWKSYTIIEVIYEYIDTGIHTHTHTHTHSVCFRLAIFY